MGKRVRISFCLHSIKPDSTKIPDDRQCTPALAGQKARKKVPTSKKKSLLSKPPSENRTTLYRSEALLAKTLSHLIKQLSLLKLKIQSCNFYDKMKETV